VFDFICFHLPALPFSFGVKSKAIVRDLVKKSLFSWISLAFAYKRFDISIGDFGGVLLLDFDFMSGFIVRFKFEVAILLRGFWYLKVEDQVVKKYCSCFLST